MYENFSQSVTSHALEPSPLSQTVTPSRTPSPSSVTYFMDGLWTENTVLDQCKDIHWPNFAGMKTREIILIIYYDEFIKWALVYSV